MHGSHIRLFPEACPHQDALDTLLPDVLEFAIMAARCPHPVLLCGETGSGKTHLARRIHELGPRAGRPFIRVNCAAIPESLFEREMFGHVRGAFTDAREGRPGFLGEADGGTLFLDEIGELPLTVQPKLLAVLEEGSFRRLGSPREISVDVRVITATNRSLPEMVRQRQFRQDLFYRCSVLQGTLAPLRKRRDRLTSIVHFLLKKNASPSLPPEITDEALAVIRAHTWPGNLRELENVLRCALVFSEGGPIQPSHLSSSIPLISMQSVGDDASGILARGRYAAPADRDQEVEMIRRALQLESGNRTRAAKRLGMSRSALWIKLQKYGSLSRDQPLTGNGERNRA